MPSVLKTRSSLSPVRFRLAPVEGFTVSVMKSPSISVPLLLDHRQWRWAVGPLSWCARRELLPHNSRRAVLGQPLGAEASSGWLQVRGLDDACWRTLLDHREVGFATSSTTGITGARLARSSEISSSKSSADSKER